MLSLHIDLGDNKRAPYNFKTTKELVAFLKHQVGLCTQITIDSHANFHMVQLFNRVTPCEGSPLGKELLQNAQPIGLTIIAHLTQELPLTIVTPSLHSNCFGSLSIELATNQDTILKRLDWDKFTDKTPASQARALKYFHELLRYKTEFTLGTNDLNYLCSSPNEINFFYFELRLIKKARHSYGEHTTSTDKVLWDNRYIELVLSREEIDHNNSRSVALYNGAAQEAVKDFIQRQDFHSAKLIISSLEDNVRAEILSQIYDDFFHFADPNQQASYATSLKPEARISYQELLDQMLDDASQRAAPFYQGIEYYGDRIKFHSSAMGEICVKAIRTQNSYALSMVCAKIQETGFTFGFSDHLKISEALKIASYKAELFTPYLPLLKFSYNATKVQQFLGIRDNDWLEFIEQLYKGLVVDPFPPAEQSLLALTWSEEI